MSLFSRLFGKSEPNPEPAINPTEQAVIVHVPLSDEKSGTEDERLHLHDLQRKMEEAIANSDAGELDGDEFGGGECVIYMYSADAHRLFGVVEPFLRADEVASRGHALIRLGPPGDPETRVELRP